MISRSGFSIGMGALVFCAQLLLSPSVSGAVSADAGTAIAEINGDTVTSDKLTSFATDMEQAEGHRPVGQEELLNEYILTQLYDKIPTTATLPNEEDLSSPTPYDVVAQRSLLKRDLQKWVSDHVEVPRSELQTWYDKNVGRYTKPEQVHAYHIFMEISDDNPSSSTEKVRTRMKKLKSQIDAGTSFSLMANEHSEAASGESGGEIGNITRHMPIGPLSKPMNIKLENVFFTLKPGEVSDVVESRHGMHLLYISDKQSTRTPTLNDLMTSGILPGAVAQDKVTSSLRTMVSDAVEKYHGKELPNGTDNVTTDTVAFELDGKNYTMGNLIAVFGPRFESYLNNVKDNPVELKRLMEQALQDETMLRVAIDKGLDKDAVTAKELKMLAKREKAQARIDAIAASEATVSEDQVKAAYDQFKDELRQPEAEGYLVTVESDDALGTGTAEKARAQEHGRRNAESIKEQMATDDMTSLSRELSRSSDGKTSVSKVPRHVIGRSTDTLERQFDRAISGIHAQGGVGPVVPSSTNFLIAKLTHKYPGDPVPLVVVRGRIEARVRAKAEAEARHNMVNRLVEKGLVKYLPGAASYGKDVGSSSEGQTTAPK